MLSVIKGTMPKKEEKTKLDYAITYCKIYVQAQENYSSGKSKSSLYKTVYYGVIYSNYLYKVFDDIKSKLDDDAQAVFQNMENVKEFIKLLTPNELMRIFPITKRYDGARYQSKDYFTTMETLKEHGLDNPIGEAVDNILWDYMDTHIFNLMINLMRIIGKLHRAQTGRDMLLDFFEEQGTPLTTYSMSTDQKTGKQYMTDNDTGKTVRVRKPIPRYLKTVQGGAYI